MRGRLTRTHKAPLLPAVTVSREYGCEGYPLALHLERLMEATSGLTWTVFNQALVGSFEFRAVTLARRLVECGWRDRSGLRFSALHPTLVNP